MRKLAVMLVAMVATALVMVLTPVLTPILKIIPVAGAQERKVEPSWLHRDVAELHESHTDLTTGSCHYTPIFGEGDARRRCWNSWL